MIKHLHEQGYKLVLWHTSWINNKSNPPGEKGFEGKLEEKSPNYDEAAGNGYFVQDLNGAPWVGTWWKGKGSLIDFTNPSAKLWWQNQVRQAIAAGADGFKDDDAEGALLGSGEAGDVKFHDGTDPRLMRNRYGTLYNNADGRAHPEGLARATACSSPAPSPPAPTASASSGAATTRPASRPTTASRPSSPRASPPVSPACRSGARTSAVTSASLTRLTRCCSSAGPSSPPSPR